MPCPQIFSSYMVLRATCEEVLRKIKAEVASDTLTLQAGAGKPEPAGAASVHVTAAAAALDGVDPMQPDTFSEGTGCAHTGLRGMAPSAWPALDRFAQRGLLRELWYLYTNTASRPAES